MGEISYHFVPFLVGLLQYKFVGAGNQNLPELQGEYVATVLLCISKILYSVSQSSQLSERWIIGCCLGKIASSLSLAST